MSGSWRWALSPFSLLGQGGAAVRGAARYYLVFSLVLAAALVLVSVLRDWLKKDLSGVLRHLQ